MAAAAPEELEVPILSRTDVEFAVRAAARRCFREIDEDGDTTLRVSELARYFAVVTKADGRPMLTRAEATRVAQAALDSADLDHDGALSVSEFVAAFVSRIVPDIPDFMNAIAAQQFVLVTDSCRHALAALGAGFPTDASLARTARATQDALFEQCDADSDGRIGGAELERLLRECVIPTLYARAGADVDGKAEAARLLRAVDVNMDGKCNRSEFRDALDAIRKEYRVSHVQWLGLCHGVFLPILTRGR